MIFDRFDIKFFKSLEADGLLSGKLYIENNDSASFSNAKIEDFLYKDYNFDEVGLEGSFNDEKLILSDLGLNTI